MTLTAEARYQKQWKYDRAHGIKRTAPTVKARAHIESLSMSGASYRSIADAAGLSVQAVCHIRDGQSTAKVTTLRAILAVTLEATMDRIGREDFVLNVGARRRMQALMRIGHKADTIGDVVGHPSRWVYNLINQGGRWISREKHEQACAAYDALSMTPGTSGKTITLATVKGWAPPLAWDDESIDDPYAAPEFGQDDTSPWEKFTYEALLDCIEWGMDRDQAARRLGVDRSAIDHRCAREDRRDLLTALDANRTKSDLRLTVAS